MRLHDQPKNAANSEINDAPLASFLENLRTAYVRRLDIVEETPGDIPETSTDPANTEKAGKTRAKESVALELWKNKMETKAGGARGTWCIYRCHGAR